MSEEAEDIATRVSRGATARRVLDEPIVMDAFEALMSELRDQIVATDPADMAGRETLYHQHLGLQTVLGTLKTWQAECEAITAARQGETKDDQR